jgi:hypothetical protein
VLVGNSHPLYDHEDQDHGMEREGEDKTGMDIRFTDVAAYRLSTRSSISPSGSVRTQPESSLRPTNTHSADV